MRIISGGKWTGDGRWVVVGPWTSAHLNETFPEVIVFDPAFAGNPWQGLQECIDWVKEQMETGATGSAAPC